MAAINALGMLYWFTKAFLCAFMIYAWVFAVRFDVTGNAKSTFVSTFLLATTNSTSSQVPLWASDFPVRKKLSTKDHIMECQPNRWDSKTRMETLNSAMMASNV